MLSLLVWPKVKLLSGFYFSNSGIPCHMLFTSKFQISNSYIKGPKVLRNWRLCSMKKPKFHR
jgi:hypothetical protein